MISRATAHFWRLFRQLPGDARRQAQRAYQIWANDPYHGSLKFKQVDPERPIYSVRIGIHWRAMGIREGQTVVWFWIGSHAEYDRQLRRL
jgi:putative hemolysin